MSHLSGALDSRFWRRDLVAAPPAAVGCAAAALAVRLLPSAGLQVRRLAVRRGVVPPGAQAMIMTARVATGRPELIF